MLDFADTNADPSGMHLAFLVTERQFDEISDRITERAMPYWADPRRNEPDQINHHDGGRCVYFGDPHTNVGWEIITRPYGSGPKGEQTDMNAARVQTESERGDEADD